MAFPVNCHPVFYQCQKSENYQENFTENIKTILNSPEKRCKLFKWAYYIHVLPSLIDQRRFKIWFSNKMNLSQSNIYIYHNNSFRLPMSTLLWAKTLHKRWSFPLRISSVNVTSVSSGFRHIYWRNSLWKTSLFLQWKLKESLKH